MMPRNWPLLEDVDVGALSPRGASPDTRGYRLENVGTMPQRVVFVGMQLLLLAILLWLSVRIITIFFSQLIGPTSLLAILIVYCTFAVFWRSVYVYRILKMQRAVLVDTQVPSGLRIALATTIVPSREFQLLRAKLEGMIRVDRCGNTIDCWVLDEEDDPRVKSMIREFNRRYRRRGARLFHFSRKHHEQYNERPEGRRFKRFQQRQKGGNINAWLDSIPLATYDIVTFLDLDHVPKPQFYRKVLPYFRDRDVAFVQGPESFRNRGENFITRAASFERDTFFGLVHRSYFGLGMPVIVGSHTTFRSETIRGLGGFYPVHLTEDYLIMLELRSLRKRGIFTDEVLAVGELPSTWAAYLGQQYRWAAGGLDLLFCYFPRLFRTYTLKEKLYYFALLNYYAWGTFYVFMKGCLQVFLLIGLALHLATGLVVGVVVFTAAAAIANYLWERQFFIEKEQRSFFIENAIMNNFLGCHYFVALLRAIASPNMPFSVTAKSGATGARQAGRSSFLRLSCAFVAVDIVGLAAWAAFAGGAGLRPASLYTNILVYPLLVSAAGNLLVLLFWQRSERQETSRARPRLRVFASPSGAVMNQDRRSAAGRKRG
jgi:cellulose synthase (UDP-forming)